MIYCLIFCAFILGFIVGYFPHRRSDKFNEDLLDRLSFREPGDYLIMKYQRQKLQSERKNWWDTIKEKVKPDPKEEVHKDDVLKIERDKRAAEQMEIERAARDKAVQIMKQRITQRQEFVKAGQEPPLG